MKLWLGIFKNLPLSERLKQFIQALFSDIQGQRTHVGINEMYEMDRTYQKFYTQLAEELTVFFFLCK